MGVLKGICTHLCEWCVRGYEWEGMRRRERERERKREKNLFNWSLDYTLLIDYNYLLLNSVYWYENKNTNYKYNYTNLSAMATKNRMILRKEPASTINPANSPLLEEWQSAYRTTFDMRSPLFQSSFLQCLCVPMFCHMMNSTPTSLLN